MVPGLPRGWTLATMTPWMTQLATDPANQHSAVAGQSRCRSRAGLVNRRRKISLRSASSNQPSHPWPPLTLLSAVLGIPPAMTT